MDWKEVLKKCVVKLGVFSSRGYCVVSGQVPGKISAVLWSSLGLLLGILVGFWEALGLSWAALGLLLGHLGRSWEALGLSWAVLGGSWTILGFLGQLLCALGRLWSDLGRHVGAK